MITLSEKSVDLIRNELASIPEKYQKPFNSVHEGLAVLREEYVELENEIFFGEKAASKEYKIVNHVAHPLDKEESFGLYKDRIRNEAVQVAAMAVRIIQELT